MKHRDEVGSCHCQCATSDPVIQPGTYYTIDRHGCPVTPWKSSFDMTLRYESGGGEMAGKMSVFRGPILLAYDSLLNDDDVTRHTPLTPADLEHAKVSRPSRTSDGSRIGQFPPWIIVDIPRPQGPRSVCAISPAPGRAAAGICPRLRHRQIAPPPPCPIHRRTMRSCRPAACCSPCGIGIGRR